MPTSTEILSKFSKTLIVTSAVLFLWAGDALLSSDRGVSQAQESDRGDAETRKTPAMREKVYKRLAEAQEMVEAGNTAGAESTLKELQGMRDLNSYEIAQTWSFFGYIYYTAENYPASIKAYETVLQQPDIPVGMENSTMYTLAQLYFTMEDYNKAEQMLKRWFKGANDPGPEPYILLGQAYYQLERYKDAIGPVETAIDLAQKSGREVKENWWLLLRVFYYELENYPKVVEILETLVREYQKKDYWVQLSGMYGELGNQRRQLAAYEVAYLQGWLQSNSELVTMAQLFMQDNYPYKGAQILEKGIKEGKVTKDYKNYRLLAQAYQMAREDKKSILPLTEAAKLAEDGDLYYRLAQAYSNLDRWQDCVEAVDMAIRKGGMKRDDNAYVLQGMAYFNMDDLGKAEKAFQQARKDERSRRVADQWLSYIVSERERQAGLDRALAALKSRK
ncbi:MAG: tetratricopeptide repeat protein [Gammaproteobacteria bacterium]|jgi:tetratricopeptide (TPR) repeat protein|nr:tetratricopeptide repeat protein [Gammaproteobacteria bacterium]